MSRPRYFADPGYAVEHGIFRSPDPKGRERKREALHSIIILAGENLTDAELSIPFSGLTEKLKCTQSTQAVLRICVKRDYVGHTLEQMLQLHVDACLIGCVSSVNLKAPQ